MIQCPSTRPISRTRRCAPGCWTRTTWGGAGADGLLTGTELSAVTDLRLAGLGIADLSGIQHFTALESLTVKDNALTSLDMSGNPRLRFLHCANNALTSLNVTGCPQLVELNCEHNRLETLDLSGNPALVQLYCRHNDLKALDVSHNPELAFIETFDNRLEEFDCSMLKKLKFLQLQPAHHPGHERQPVAGGQRVCCRQQPSHLPDPARDPQLPAGGIGLL